MTLLFKGLRRIGWAVPVASAALSGSALAAAVPSFSAASRLSLALSAVPGARECPTAALIELSRTAPAQVQSLLGSAPVLLREQIWIDPATRTAYHFTVSPESPDAVPAADRDGSGVPDQIEVIAGAMREAWASGAAAGLTRRPGAKETPRAVWLADLGGEAAGYAIALPAAMPYAVIDPTPADEQSLRDEAAHLAAHLLLFERTTAGPGGWHEATATWLEVSARRDAGRHAAAAARLLREPERGLFASILQDGRSGWIWAAFLSESAAPGTAPVAGIWEALADNPALSLGEATSAALAVGGRSLRDAFVQFNYWNLFTGSRDDGRHYSFGFLLPEPAPAASHDRYPALSIGTGRPIGAYGASTIRLEPDGGPGGVTVSVETEPGPGWEIELLVAAPHLPRVWRRVPVRLDEKGRGTVRAPWDDAAEMILMVRRPSLDAPASRLSYVVTPDEAFPFELTSLAAEPEAGQIRLVWETESERDLVGWQVLRATGRGPLLPVEGIMVPALGTEDGPVSYQFVDDGVTAGAVYRYRIVGVTIEGLTQRSFIVTARAGR